MSRNSLIPTEATADEIADLLALTPRRVRQVAGERGIKGSARGLLPLRAVVAAVLETARKARDSDVLSGARARREVAKARLIEIQTAEVEAKLIDIDEHFAVIDAIVGVFIASLNSLPARIARNNVVERRRIEDICSSIQSEIVKTMGEEAAKWPKK